MSCYSPVCCPPSCAIPSCASAPVMGLGSCGYGSPTSASSLGIAPGASISCVGQIPPSEVVIQPPPFVVVVPGPVLSASCEPLSVGGYTACSSGVCRPRRRRSICAYPC